MVRHGNVAWTVSKTERKLLLVSARNIQSSSTLDERQQPVFQVQTHVRCRVRLPEGVPPDVLLAKLGIANPQLIFSQEVMHFMAPIAVRRSASNCEWFQNKLRRIAPVYASSSPGG